VAINFSKDDETSGKHFAWQMKDDGRKDDAPQLATQNNAALSQIFRSPKTFSPALGTCTFAVKRILLYTILLYMVGGLKP